MRLQALSDSISDLHRSYVAASPGAGRDQAIEALRKKLEERRSLLTNQIEGNPDIVLGASLPPGLRAGLPALVRPLIEQERTITGTIDVVYEERLNGKSYLRHSIREKNTDQTVELFFRRPPPGLLSGMSAEVFGVFVPGKEGKGGSMALQSGDSVLTLAAKGGKRGGNNGEEPAETDTALGERKTLVILVNFQDFPEQPYTRSFAEQLVFDTTSNYFYESSHEQTWLSGDVVGWFTIPVSSEICDRNAIASEADKAAVENGVDVDSYDHRIYAFPQISCGWWGLSSVGGNPSMTWITGKLKLGVTAHELGHSFGLYHSHSLDCGNTSIGSACIEYQYGDTLDMMGSSAFAHFNPFQKEMLGWLNTASSPETAVVDSSGTYVVESYARPAGTGPKALKVLKSLDPNSGEPTWYYIQARQAHGFDSGFSSNSNVLNGVSILLGTESNRDSSYLLDMTPGSGDTIYLDWSDPALEVGQSFTDPLAGVTITTEWITDAQAGVTIEFSSSSVGGLSVEVVSNKLVYSKGETAYMSVEVSSDGWPIAGAMVNMTIIKPDGDEMIVSGTTNSSGVFNYTLRLKRKDPVGTYRVDSLVDDTGIGTAFFSVE